MKKINVIALIVVLGMLFGSCQEEELYLQSENLEYLSFKNNEEFNSFVENLKHSSIAQFQSNEEATSFDHLINQDLKNPFKTVELSHFRSMLDIYYEIANEKNPNRKHQLLEQYANILILDQLGNHDLKIPDIALTAVLNPYGIVKIGEEFVMYGDELTKTMASGYENIDKLILATENSEKYNINVYGDRANKMNHSSIKLEKEYFYYEYKLVGGEAVLIRFRDFHETFRDPSCIYCPNSRLNRYGVTMRTYYNPGNGPVEFACKNMSFSGKVLYYGSGPDYLTAASGVNTSAIQDKYESTESANNIFNNYQGHNINYHFEVLNYSINGNSTRNKSSAEN